jgi:hypothetical protein
LHEKNENLPMPGGCPGGGMSQLELTDALTLGEYRQVYREYREYRQVYREYVPNLW